MKVVKSDSGFLIFNKIFKLIQSNRHLLTLWQVTSSGERNILKSCLNSFHMETKFLHLKRDDEIEIDLGQPVFCYSPDTQCIFKSSVKDIKTGVLSIAIPDEIKFLDEDDVKVIKGASGIDLAAVWKVKSLNLDIKETPPDFMRVKSMKDRTTRDQELLNKEFYPIGLDEEEKLFAGQRETPRGRPKIDKWVKVVSSLEEKVLLLRLFDLSQGGISFITPDTHLFPKGSSIKVVGFNDFDLDDPLIGEVMSERAIDESKLDYKIGCKFQEGQS
jgi:hypothetical protein